MPGQRIRIEPVAPVAPGTCIGVRICTLVGSPQPPDLDVTTNLATPATVRRWSDPDLRDDEVVIHYAAPIAAPAPPPSVPADPKQPAPAPAVDPTPSTITVEG